MDDIAIVKQQIINLATAIKQMNQYGSRIGSVAMICDGILAPAPNEAAAAEDLAGLKAVISKRGTIVSISCDWDAEWHFITTFRFAEGFYVGDGFDLRPGEPGHGALLEAITICRLTAEVCDLTAPEPAGVVPSRRIIFPRPQQTAEAA